MAFPATDLLTRHLGRCAQGPAARADDREELSRRRPIRLHDRHRARPQLETRGPAAVRIHQRRTKTRPRNGRARRRSTLQLSCRASRIADSAVARVRQVQGRRSPLAILSRPSAATRAARAADAVQLSASAWSATIFRPGHRRFARIDARRPRGRRPTSPPGRTRRGEPVAGFVGRSSSSRHPWSRSPRGDLRRDRGDYAAGPSGPRPRAASVRGARRRAGSRRGRHAAKRANASSGRWTRLQAAIVAATTAPPGPRSRPS